MSSTRKITLTVEQRIGRDGEDYYVVVGIVNSVMWSIDEEISKVCMIATLENCPNLTLKVVPNRR